MGGLTILVGGFEPNPLQDMNVKNGKSSSPQKKRCENSQKNLWENLPPPQRSWTALPFQPRHSNLSDICSIPQVLQLLPIGTSSIWCCFFRHFSKAQLGGSLQQIHAGALLAVETRSKPRECSRGEWGSSMGTFFTAGKFQVANSWFGNW